MRCEKKAEIAFADNTSSLVVELNDAFHRNEATRISGTSLWQTGSFKNFTNNIVV